MNSSAAIDQWYRTPVERAVMKRLTRRSDREGLIQVAGYFSLVIICGYLASRSIGSWWSLPAFLLYGGIWVFATSVVHETSHGTPFKTRWINEVVLFIGGLMVQQLPTGLRWTHARHHSETAMVGRDVEIVLVNPITWFRFLTLQLGDTNSIWYYFSRIVLFALGGIDAAHKECVPEKQIPRLRWEARAFLGVYCVIVIWSIYIQSWWPILMFLLPRITGAPVHGVMLATQHIGFSQNIYDHRKTTRTMKVNPLLGFIYWNMNYHVEHHMFPNVPFHALPALQKEIRYDLPTPTAGVAAALEEMIHVVRCQKVHPDYACHQQNL